MKYLLSLLSILLCFQLTAGESTGNAHSGKLQVERKGFVKVQEIEQKYYASVIKRFGKHRDNIPGWNEHKAEMWEQKQNAPHGIGNDSRSAGRNVPFTINQSYRANGMSGGTPPDNSMAISKEGFVVSADNATMIVYDTVGNFVEGSSHNDFWSTLNPNSSIFDPRVIYDDVEDRFIYVILHGNTAGTSEIYIAFSETGDPRDGWNLYAISGTLDGTSYWTDYPNIGLSNSELFITGNLFQGGPTITVIHQMDKFDGYNGDPIDYITWTDVRNSTGSRAFTIVPATNGHDGHYGDNMYFLATNSSFNGNAIDVFEITSHLNDDDLALNSFRVSVPSFSVAGNAAQLNTNQVLDIGDNRMQECFYLNGVLHFAFPCNWQSGFGGINYGRIEVATRQVQTTRFGTTGFDYTYPAVASLSNSPNDHSVVIGFLASGSSIYPEVRAITIDNDMNVGSSELIKEGESYVDIVADDEERWGDYSGIHRRKGIDRVSVWYVGCIGMNNFSRPRFYDAWVAEFVPNVSAITADFIADKTSGPAPLSVQFTNLSVGNPDNYVWDLEGAVVPASGDQNPSAVYTVPGTYSVKLDAYSSGAGDIEFKQDYITVTSPTSSIDDLDNLNAEVQVYPNPVFDFMNIDFEVIGEAHVDIAIYDAAGAKVKQFYDAAFKSGPYTFRFDKSGMESGTYFVQIKVDNKTLHHEQITVVD